MPAWQIVPVKPMFLKQKENTCGSLDPGLDISIKGLRNIPLTGLRINPFWIGSMV
jgi:hypothetical protein